MKKTLTVILSLVLLVGLVPAFAVSSTDALQTLINYNVIKGDGNGYMENQVLQRQNAAIILTRMMGVEDAAKITDPTGLPFVDLQDKMSSETTKIIAYTYNKTWFRGMSNAYFGWGENITAQQFATIMLRALGYDPVYDTAFETAVELGLFEGTSGLTKTSPIIRNDVYIAMYNTLNKVPKNENLTLKEILGLTDVEDLKVETIKSEGMKVISVKFNKAYNVDAGTVITVKKNGVSVPHSIDYVNERNMILIDLNTVQSQNTTLTVKISGVKGSDGSIMPQVEQDVNFMDITMPSVKSIEVLNPKTIRIKTTEPLNYGGNYYKYHNDIKVDGTKIYAKIRKTLFNELVLEFNQAIAAGTYTLEVINIPDYEGFPLESYQGEFEIVADNDAPELVSMYVLNNKTILAEFDEKLADEGNFTVVGNTVQSVSVSTPNSKEVRINLQNKLDLAAILGITVKYSGQKDDMDNEITQEQTIEIMAQDDTTAPTVEITKVERNAAGNAIEMKLTFSESMEVPNPYNPIRNTIEFKDSDGNPFPATIANRSWDNENTELTFSVSELYNKDAEDFTLVLNDFKDMSVRENEMPETSDEFNCPDTKAPTVLGLTDTTSSEYFVDGNSITIKFSEEMDDSHFTNLSNYRIYKTDADGGSFIKLLADVAGASVNVVSPKELTISVDDINDMMYDQSGTMKYSAIKLQQMTDIARNMLVDTEIVKGIPTPPVLAIDAGEKEVFLKKNDGLYYFEINFDTPVKVLENDSVTYGGQVLEQITIGQPEEYSTTLTFGVPSSVTVNEGADNLGLDSDVVFASTAGAEALVTEYGVKNTSDLTIDSDASSTEFKDKVAPTMLVEPEFLSDNKTIKLEYSEPINSDANIQSCTVTLANQVVGVASYTTSTTNNFVEVVLDQAIAQSENGKSVMISIQVKDDAGNTAGLITKNLVFQHQ